MKKLSMVEKNQNSNTKNNKTTNSISSIVEAHIGKRLIASLLDGFIAIFLFLFFSIICLTPIANNAFSYSQKQVLGYQYQTASHLYVVVQRDEAGVETNIEVKDYSEKINPNLDITLSSLANREDLEPNYYLDHLHYYYTSFLTGENIEMPNNTPDKTYDMVNDHFVSPDYLTKNKDNLLPKEVYTDKWFNEEILKINGDGAAYFEINDINNLASIKSLENNDDLIKFLRNRINDAAGDLYYRDYYQKLNNDLKLIQLFIIGPSFVAAMLLVYLLPTMLFKNGETLGKKFMHLAIISKDGYAAKKRQYIFRFIVFFFEIALSTFVVGIGFTSIATLGVGILALFIATLINKDHRSLHDFAAMTLVVDANKSVWFDSKVEEQQKLDEINKNMEKYRSQKIENKNIIQIGDKILDDELRKKVEKQNKNK